jgi:hypothetical protein
MMQSEGKEPTGVFTIELLKTAAVTDAEQQAGAD